MLTIKDILLIVKNRIKAIVSITILFAFIGAGFTFLTAEPIYTATASMYVLNKTNRTEGISATELSTSQRLVNTYIVILQSDTTLNIVSEQLERNELYFNETKIKEMLSAGSIDNTEAFYISIKHENPQIAKTIANTILEVVPDEIIRVVEAGSVKVIDYAKTDEKPFFPITKNVLVFALFGLILSGCFYLMETLFDTRIHDELILKQVFDLPIVGIIPRYGSSSDNGRDGENR